MLTASSLISTIQFPFHFSLFRRPPTAGSLSSATMTMLRRGASTLAGKANDSLSRTAAARWAVGGWVFFIAENVILSENRAYLIEQMGSDDTYHAVYGALSTAATVSIGVAYVKLRRNIAMPSAFTPTPWLSLSRMITAWTNLSIGAVLASQAIPKLQIPVHLQQGDDSTKLDDVSEKALRLQVRCPFDFTDRRHDNGSTIQGLERVSRHPGLWSLGLMALGQASLQTNPAMILWWTGPAWVAWLGGAHQDSRFRRGLGGTLDPHVESQTSNVPFVAMVTGKQGAVSENFQALWKETKPLNALLAMGAASAWVASRGKVRIR